MQGDPVSGEPALYRTLICDKTTAYTAAQAITAALFARATGRAGGQHIELAMLDTAIAFMWPDSAMDAALGRPELADDPRFADMMSRMANTTAMVEVLVDAAASCTVEDFAARAVEHDVPASTVTSLDAIHDDPQVVHNDVFLERDHPQHSDEIARELGSGPGGAARVSRHLLTIASGTTGSPGSLLRS